MIIKHVTLHQNWRHKRDKKRGTSETKRESQARYRPSQIPILYIGSQSRCVYIQKTHVYPEENHVRNSQFMLAHMLVLKS